MYFYCLYKKNLFSQEEKEVWRSCPEYSTKKDAREAAEKDVDEEEARPFLEDYIAYDYEVFNA